MKILIITSEPENYVPVELKKAGEKLGVEVVIAVTENFSVTYNYGADFEINYCDHENDVTITNEEIRKFDLCIPRLNDSNLELKKELLLALNALNLLKLNTAGGMIACQEKISTERILSTEGIPTPKTKFILGPNGIGHEDFTYPVIMKTNTGSQGIGVMKLDSYESVKSVGQVLHEKCIPFLIQTCIPHEFSYRMIMLGDKVLAANKRAVPKDEFRSNSHQNGKLIKNTEKYEPSQEEIELGIKIVMLLGCKFCAIDYLIDDGKFIILEVNGSPGLEGIQEDYPDVNLSEELLKYCMSIDDPIEVASDSIVGPDIDEIPNPEMTEIPPNMDVASVDDENFVGETEEIIIERFNNDEPIEAKVDTGADSCSIHGENIVISDDNEVVTFEFNNIIYKIPVEKTILIVKADHEKTKRAIIKMNVIFKGKTYDNIHITVADRSDLAYNFLIGKNLLAEINEPIKIEKSEEE